MNSDIILTDKFLKAFGKKMYKVIYYVSEINVSEYVLCYFVKNNITEAVDIGFYVFDDDNTGRFVAEYFENFNEDDYEFVDLSNIMFYKFKKDSERFENFLKRRMTTIFTSDGMVYCELSTSYNVNELFNHEKYKEIIDAFVFLCGLSEEVREWCES